VGGGESACVRNQPTNTERSTEAATGRVVRAEMQTEAKVPFHCPPSLVLARRRSHSALTAPFTLHSALHSLGFSLALTRRPSGVCVTLPVSITSIEH